MPRSYPAIQIPERYLTALGDHDPIESMRKAPKRLRKLLKELHKRGWSHKRLARRPAEGQWSIKDVLAHLADGEVVLGARIRMVAAMDRPVIVGYDQDALVARLAYEKVDAEELLANFAAMRAINVALLERLPEEAFARVGLHSERGEESLAAMVFMYAGHDRIHEQQIVNAGAAKRRAKRKGAATPAVETHEPAAIAEPAPSSEREGKKRDKHAKRDNKGKREKHAKRKARELANVP